MDLNRSNPRTSPARQARAVGLLLLLSGCGQQAGEDYRGEPMLRLQGQAVISALTGGQAIRPALCFFMAFKPDAPEFNPNTIPAELHPRLSLPWGLAVESFWRKRVATHILEVESRGEFPAQFDVEVYVPPPPTGLSPAWVRGEPNWARGRVCAVPADHAAVTFPLASGGISDPQSGQYTYALASLQNPRFYYEAYDCPPGTLPQNAGTCPKTSAGDPSLAFEYNTGDEYRSESVLGTARDFEVLYLDADAPAGSFTAFSWGAPDGLSAGYHLIAPRVFPEGPPTGLLECINELFPEEERLISERWGERIKEEFGPDYTYNALTARNADGSDVVDLPDDVYLGALEIMAHLYQDNCSFEAREYIDPNLSTLSIDIASNASASLAQHFGFVSFGGEGEGFGAEGGEGE